MKAIRAGRRRWDAEQFRSVQSAQRASGLSVQVFCQREGINLSSFYRWRRVVSGRRAAPGRLAVAGGTPSVSEFIPLAALPMGMVAGLTLKFDLGGGMTLTVTR